MKTSERLVKMLAEKGYNVTLLMPARGYWKRHLTDTMPWQAYVQIESKPQKQDHLLGSWETMTHLVRNGFRVVLGSESSGVTDFEAVDEEKKAVKSLKLNRKCPRCGERRYNPATSVGRALLKPKITCAECGHSWVGSASIEEISEAKS